MRVGGGYGSRSKVAARAVGSDELAAERRLGGCATVVAEPARVARRRSGDGRGAFAAAPSRRNTAAQSAGQAATGSFSLLAHWAANTAGAFIPSDECGRRQL